MKNSAYLFCGSRRINRPAPPCDVFRRILSIIQCKVFRWMFGENSTTRYVSKMLVSSEPLSSSDVVVYPPELQSSVREDFLRCFSPFSTDVTLATSGSLMNLFDSNACNWILRCRNAGGMSTVFVSILHANNCGEINWAVCLTSFGRAFGFSMYRTGWGSRWFFFSCQVRTYHVLLLTFLLLHFSFVMFFGS